MKKLYFLLGFTLIALYSYSQQLVQLTYEGRVVQSGEHFYIDAISEEVKIDFWVENITSEEVDAKVVRNRLSVIPGSSDYFCFFLCYEPHVDVSQVAPVFEGEPELLQIDYVPAGANGESIISYTLSTPNNGGEEIIIFLHFLEGSYVSIMDSHTDAEYVRFVSGEPKLNYQLEGDKRLFVYGTTGALVGSSILPAGTQTYDLPFTLPQGIYIYTLKEGNDVYRAGKFIIR